MAKVNGLADALLAGGAQQGVDLGALRRARRFDVNNYERVVNDVTGRVTSNQSQQLSVAQGLGLNTSGLIVGGQRDTDTPGGVPGQGVAGGRSRSGEGQRGGQRTSDKVVTTGQSGQKKITTGQSGIPLSPTEKRLNKKGLL